MNRGVPPAFTQPPWLSQDHIWESLNVNLTLGSSFRSKGLTSKQQNPSTIILQETKCEKEGGFMGIKQDPTESPGGWVIRQGKWAGPKRDESDRWEEEPWSHGRWLRSGGCHQRWWHCVTFMGWPDSQLSRHVLRLDTQSLCARVNFEQLSLDHVSISDQHKTKKDLGPLIFHKGSWTRDHRVIRIIGGEEWMQGGQKAWHIYTLYPAFPLSNVSIMLSLVIKYLLQLKNFQDQIAYYDTLTWKLEK